MQTMHDPLERAHLVAPRSEAMVCGDVRLTYAEVWSRCDRLVAHFAGLGLTKGDRVAVIAANCHRYLETYLALPAAGFVLVPLNTRSSDAEQEYAIRDSNARVLVTDRPPGPLDALVEHVVRLPGGYEDAIADVPASLLGEGRNPTGENVTDGDLAGIFYTGGTTGKAKGVMLTHRNLMANTWTALGWARTTQEDRWLVMAPLFHAAGTCSVLATVWVGGVQLVLANFDAGRTLDLIEREHATSTLAVPTMLAAIADEQLERPRNVGSLRLLSHGASPIPTETLRRAAKAFPDAELLHLYGTTETSPIATTLAREERLLDTPLARSCGQAALGVRVEVAGLDGSTSPFGQAGEVRIRGDNVMAGYWQRPEETARALRDGWYYTGDIGYLDETSHLFLVDRAKDMIVTGGENVYTIEVEEALACFPGVAECAVFGVPDDRWGEAVYAVVVPRAAEELDPSALLAHCRSLIAGFKAPKQIEVRSEPLPKSGAGKILKKELREPHWEGHTTRIGN